MVDLASTDNADPTILQCLRAALAPLADARRAAAMRAYLRGQFDFLGVPTPNRRAAVAPVLR